jgi:hypothetical protein
MVSSGDFGLVVIHALSHIKVDPSNLSNDSNPLFMQEFFANLKILSQDLFKATSTPSSIPLLSPTPLLPTQSPPARGGSFEERSPVPRGSKEYASIRRGSKEPYPVFAPTGPLSSPNSNPNLNPNSYPYSNTNANSKTNISSNLNSTTASNTNTNQSSPAPRINKRRNSSYRGSSMNFNLNDRESGDRRERGDKDYFSSESIHDRLRVYAKEGGVPLDYIDKYAEHRRLKGKAALPMGDNGDGPANPNSIAEEP